MNFFCYFGTLLTDTFGQDAFLVLLKAIPYMHAKLKWKRGHEVYVCQFCLHCAMKEKMESF